MRGEASVARPQAGTKGEMCMLPQHLVTTLTAILAATVLSSCRPPGNDAGTRSARSEVRERDQVSKMLKDHYHSFHQGYEIRGPLTAVQLKEELTNRYEKGARVRKAVYGTTETFEESETGENFARLEAEHEAGGRIYFFRSDSDSWMHLSGIEGYVLVRGNELIDMIVTAIN